MTEHDLLKLVNDRYTAGYDHGLQAGHSEWVKCSERLPDKHGYYLCHYWHETKRCYQDFWFTGSYFSTTNKITDWRELPPAPESKDE